MELLSDKKLLYYLRFYSVYLVIISFCVIVSLLVREPERVVSIIVYFMMGISGLILFLLLFIKKNYSTHEKRVFVVAAISTTCDIVTSTAASNVQKLEYAFSLLIAFSLCLYSLYLNKLPNPKLVKACMITTIVMGILSALSIIHFYSMEQPIDFENISFFVMVVVVACFYVFNALFFQINAYRLMLSKARMLDAQQ